MHKQLKTIKKFCQGEVVSIFSLLDSPGEEMQDVWQA